MLGVMVHLHLHLVNQSYQIYWLWIRILLGGGVVEVLDKQNLML